MSEELIPYGGLSTDRPQITTKVSRPQITDSEIINLMIQWGSFSTRWREDDSTVVIYYRGLPIAEGPNIREVMRRLGAMDAAQIEQLVERARFTGLNLRQNKIKRTPCTPCKTIHQPRPPSQPSPSAPTSSPEPESSSSLLPTSTPTE